MLKILFFISFKFYKFNPLKNQKRFNYFLGFFVYSFVFNVLKSENISILNLFILGKFLGVFKYVVIYVNLKNS
ncbi:hypothetical protein Mgra_00001248 [Meloidogyne graminicola]|uniref:Uncharacterized protein n=1 Tax=Meloidogyne graminicola TaxID=189291 RepID=A0A8T0A086_9BILA|nr:hypothetical protein Mgra_00001248 [Meloidogyne graminicola]